MTGTAEDDPFFGDFRGRRIAGDLLDMAVAGMRSRGVSPLYLLTDHTGFYERYGWEFFCLAQGAEVQAVVCQAVGGKAGNRLWWFADGKAVGESSGSRPFAVELGRGDHVVTCATDGGTTSSVRVRVK